MSTTLAAPRTTRQAIIIFISSSYHLHPPIDKYIININIVRNRVVVEVQQLWYIFPPSMMSDHLEVSHRFNKNRPTNTLMQQINRLFFKHHKLWTSESYSKIVTFPKKKTYIHYQSERQTHSAQSYRISSPSPPFENTPYKKNIPHSTLIQN